MDFMPLSGSQLGSQTFDSGTEVLHVLSGPLATNYETLRVLGIIEGLQKADLLLGSVAEDNSFGRCQVTQIKLPISYPPEWTFETLRVAGLKYLEMFEFLRPAGFGLVDCHPYNFVLENNTPKWVDVGSFTTRSQNSSDFLFPEMEFLEYYIAPLRMYKRRRPVLGKLLLNPRRHVDLDQILDLRITLIESGFRALPRKVRSRMRRLIYGPITRYEIVEVEDVLLVGLVKILSYVVFKLRVRFLNIRVSRYKRFLRSLKNRSLLSEGWGHYDKFSEVSATPRFQKILAIIQEINPSSILDIGGSSGYLELALLKESPILAPACVFVVDKEESSLNLGIQRSRELGLNVNFAYFDFANPWTNDQCLDYSVRFKSELVVMLALHHHLFLTERMSNHQIIQRLVGLTEKFLIVEFMPLGLWVPGAALNNVEDYDVSSFKSVLEEFFEIIEEEQIEANRILFVCELRKNVVS